MIFVSLTFMISRAGSGLDHPMVTFLKGTDDIPHIYSANLSANIYNIEVAAGQEMYEPLHPAPDEF